MPGDDPVALDDKGVVGCAFGHRAILDKPGVIDLRGLGGHLGHRGIQKLRRLDVAPPPSQIGNRDHLPAGLGGGVFGKAGLGLGEHHNCRRHLRPRKGEIAIAGIAAGDLQIDHAVDDLIAGDHLAEQDQPFGVRMRVGHAKLGQRACQPHAMAGKVDQLAAEDRGDLIDPVRHQKPPVKDRHHRFGFGQVLAVHMDDAGHLGLLLRA